MIGLAGSVDPSKLRADQQQAFADALDREAERRLKAEKEAQDARKEQNKITAELNGYLKYLTKLASEGGLPVNLGTQAVTVVEVTTPKLGVNKRSSRSRQKRSTADAMDPVN